MSFEGRCPACGSPVVFDVANSLATICPACRSVVGRGDGKLETYGKIADLAQTDSPLQVGLRGKFKGIPFEITGRTQYRHSQGGVWDEWYAAFRDGQKWGWIAEAQGRVYLTFEQELPKDATLPLPEDLSVDAELMIPKVGAMRVAEIGDGTVLSAEGELPFVAKPGEPVRFADLAGKGRKFATIDSTNGHAVLYAGGQVTFDQLGIGDQVRSREQEMRHVSTEQVNCPQCGGALELKVPDQTLRVGCPFCGSLLDCNEGKLRFLKKLKKKAEPLIPLGSVGHIPSRFLGLPGDEALDFTIIGFMQRVVTYEGTNYYWQEYLLYRPRTEFHWLIFSEGHWSIGRPVPTGDVESGMMNARAEGMRFRVFDRSTPRVDYVLGEFYWKVTVGEKVEAADFISPPFTLSREVSLHGNSEGTDDVPEKRGKNKKYERFVASLDDLSETVAAAALRRSSGKEVNYTLSRYVTPAEVESAFDVDDLPRPSSVAPNQPFPHKRVYAMFGLLILAAIVAYLFVAAVSPRKTVFEERFASLPVGQGNAFASKPITLSGARNLQVTMPRGPWVYVNGDLYDERSKRIVGKFGLPTGRSVYLPAVSGGKYTLRLSATWDQMNVPSPAFSVTLKQGVPHASLFVVLLVVLTIPVILTAIAHFLFEMRRWAESDFNPFSSE